MAHAAYVTILHPLYAHCKFLSDSELIYFAGNVKIEIHFVGLANANDSVDCPQEAVSQHTVSSDLHGLLTPVKLFAIRIQLSDIKQVLKENRVLGHAVYKTRREMAQITAK